MYFNILHFNIEHLCFEKACYVFLHCNCEGCSIVALFNFRSNFFFQISCYLHNNCEWPVTEPDSLFYGYFNVDTINNFL